MERSAIISECGRYRYKLTRYWAGWVASKSVLWIMLNPSTADGAIDDATIRKCIGFSRRWGYGGIVVCNIFAWRATKPCDLPADLAIAEGPFNRATVVDAAQQAVDDGAPILVAWGGHAPRNAGESFLGWLDESVVGPQVECLGRTKSGQPRHPLMLSYATPREPYGGTDESTL